MSGVENWLHTIIAVILFAVIVELLLPHSKFLKYTRLVIGLILLLTMLSPIIKLFDKDYLTQIDASYVLWEQQLERAEQSTFSLRDIQSKAEDIQQKREQQALELTGKTIEKQMKEQLNQASISDIDKVKVTMGLIKTGQDYEPKVESVTLFVSSNNAEITESSFSEESTIELIEPVNIEVLEINRESEHEETNSESEETNSESEVLLSAEEEQIILSILQRNWDLSINQISFVPVSVEKR